MRRSLAFASVLSILCVFAYFSSVKERGSAFNSFFELLRPLARDDNSRLLYSTAELPQCGLSRQAAERYSGLKESKDGVFIAINLINAATILPALASAVNTFCQFVGPQRCAVSIYENDSTDSTPDLLSTWAKSLARIGVQKIYISSEKNATLPGNRITRMAYLRNKALLPLLEDKLPKTFTTVFFLNDIVTCQSDLLELLYQKQLQTADVVCATDWVMLHELKLYDLWTLRGLDGNIPYTWYFDGVFNFASVNGSNLVSGLFSSQSPDIHNKWIHGSAVPVYSCWNGAVALAAEAFTQSGLLFRATKSQGWRLVQSSENPWSRMVSDEKHLRGDCPASEGQTMARDIWELKERRARFVVAPWSRNAYNLKDYKAAQEKVPVLRWFPTRSQDLVDWDKTGGPAQVLCQPSIDANGNSGAEWKTPPYAIPVIAPE